VDFFLKRERDVSFNKKTNLRTILVKEYSINLKP
jgi:hypothetical protein